MRKGIEPGLLFALHLPRHGAFLSISPVRVPLACTRSAIRRFAAVAANEAGAWLSVAPIWTCAAKGWPAHSRWRLGHRPNAIPNLIKSLRYTPAGFSWAVTQKNLVPRDPNLIYYPVLYLHGRNELGVHQAGPRALRDHLEPGGGTLFADAECGSPAFDAGFRRFVAQLLPNSPLVPIPTNDVLYTTTVGADLSQIQYTKAAGGYRDFPQLEGVKIDGHWESSIQSAELDARWTTITTEAAKATFVRMRPRSSECSHLFHFAVASDGDSLIAECASRPYRSPRPRKDGPRTRDEQRGESVFRLKFPRLFLPGRYRQSQAAAEGAGNVPETEKPSDCGGRRRRSSYFSQGVAVG